MIISPIQLVRFNITCASIGYFPRLFAKKNLKNIIKYFILIYYIYGIAITKRQTKLKLHFTI